jgi:hypothetical protein
MTFEFHQRTGWKNLVVIEMANIALELMIDGESALKGWKVTQIT